MGERHPLSIEHEHVHRAERKDAMQEDYEQGLPVKHIADRYDVSPASVYKVAGKKTPLRNRKWSDEDKAQVVQAYADGWPIRAIVDRFECDRKSIWVWVVAAKVPLRYRERGRALLTSNQESGQ